MATKSTFAPGPLLFSLIYALGSVACRHQCSQSVAPLPCRAQVPGPPWRGEVPDGPEEPVRRGHRGPLPAALRRQGLLHRAVRVSRALGGVDAWLCAGLECSGGALCSTFPHRQHSSPPSPLPTSWQAHHLPAPHAQGGAVPRPRLLSRSARCYPAGAAAPSAAAHARAARQFC